MNRLLKWLGIKTPFPMAFYEIHDYWYKKLGLHHPKDYYMVEFDWEYREWRCKDCGFVYSAWLKERMWDLQTNNLKKGVDKSRSALDELCDFVGVIERRRNLYNLAMKIGKATREGKIKMTGGTYWRNHNVVYTTDENWGCLDCDIYMTARQARLHEKCQILVGDKPMPSKADKLASADRHICSAEGKLTVAKGLLRQARQMDDTPPTCGHPESCVEFSLQTCNYTHEGTGGVKAQHFVNVRCNACSHNWRLELD